MTKPYKSGKGIWSVRIRKSGVDQLLSGFATKTAASEAAREYLAALKQLGQPRRRGPRQTILAQAMSDYALERLKFNKGALQEVRRFNRWTRSDLAATIFGSADESQVKKIYRYERGLASVPLDYAVRLVHALGQSLEVLVACSDRAELHKLVIDLPEGTHAQALKYLRALAKT